MLKSILSATFWKGVGFLLGLAISVGVANVFGASAATDAYFLARRVVTNLAAALERTLQLLLVPSLVRLAQARGVAALRPRLIRRQNLALVGGAAGAAALFAAAEPIVRLLAPGFDSGQTAAAAFYLRILLLALPISAATSITAATLNALRIFSIPLIARQAPRALVLAALVVAPAGIGLDLVAAAWAAGWIVLAVVIWAAARRALRPSDRARDPSGPAVDRPALIDAGLGDGLDAAPLSATTGEAARATRATRDRIAAMLVAQAHVLGASWLDMGFASLAGTGAVATLEFGQRLVNLAPGAISTSVVLVYYTEFAAAHARGDADGFRRLIGGATRTSLSFVAPLAVALFVLSDLLVSILFAHGAFDAAAARVTGEVVAILAPVLVINAVLGVMTSAIFSDGTLPQTWMIGVATALAIVARVAFDAAVIGPLGVVAVPLGALVGAVVLLVALGTMLNARLRPLFKTADLGGFARIAAAAAAGGAAMWATRAAGGPVGPGWLDEVAACACALAVGGGVHLAAALALGVAEPVKALGRIARRARGAGAQT